MTTQRKVEKWEADSAELLDAKTYVPTSAFMFSLMFSLVSDNCHGHRGNATRFGACPFSEDKVCGQNFLLDFAAACRKMWPLVEFMTRALGQKC